MKTDIMVMRILLIVLILLLCNNLRSQPPFKAGKYNIGDQVTFLGKVYVNQKGCVNCKADPPNNSYWKEKVVPAISIDSLVKEMSFLRKELFEVKSQIKNMAQIREIYNSGKRLIILDTFQRRAAW